LCGLPIFVTIQLFNTTSSAPFFLATAAVPAASIAALTIPAATGCPSGGVPLGAVPALSSCGEVSLGGEHIIIIIILIVWYVQQWRGEREAR